jgi:hypothetical protein
VALITADELKQYMHNEIVGLDDAVYELAAQSAEQSINDHCQRAFTVAGSTADARVYVPTGHAILRIHDCTEITSVVDTVRATTYVAGTDYQAEPLNGLAASGEARPYDMLRRLGGCWPVNSDNQASITVTAKWGWAAVPTRVKMACFVIAKDILKQRDVNSGVAGFAEFGAVRVRTNAIALELLDGLQRVEAFGFA